MQTRNLGILAHVDAGKTTLTERLLFHTGVIDALGSVDDGTTQTDSLALERRRGITIRSAVASFTVDGSVVNLLDTPGHPDFIAEVERVLQVLDGVVLVVSAVEGVQPQTRVLMRTLRRLGLPTLIFVNKIDRRGADGDAVLDAIAERLTPHAVPMGTTERLGTRDAVFVPFAEVDASLASRTARAGAYPVFFGSAITGAGVEWLLAGAIELLPAADGDPDGPLDAAVFKIERDATGQRLGYVRVFSGTIRVRDRIAAADRADKVTAIDAFDGGLPQRRGTVGAGQIARLHGLRQLRVGDRIGVRSGTATAGFGPPTLETAVVPRRPADAAAVHTALRRLADQDPLIGLRQDDERRELFVSLYGEVQQEVIAATLLEEHGVEVTFRPATTICVERPSGEGTALELLHRDGNPLLATVGLRIEPGLEGSGVVFRLAEGLRSVPLYVFGSEEGFRSAMERNVRASLAQGIRGWEVTDCGVTMTDSGYDPPGTSAKDFRLLTPLVLSQALQRAGTVVCEPVHRFHLEVPAATLGSATRAAGAVGAIPDTSTVRGTIAELEGEIGAARVQDLRRQLPRIAHGEGVLETAFARYRPVHGPPPTRPHRGVDPSDRDTYLAAVRRHA